MSSPVNKSDRPILVFCFLGILACLYLLSHPEFFQSRSTNKNEIIGKVSRVTSDVRYKSKKDYFWQSSSKNGKITAGDSLFTGERSSSEIILTDGKKIKVSENSLVHFSNKNSQLAIDLAFGKVTATGLAKTLVVSDCGKTYTVDSNSADFEISKKGQCGSIQMKVKTGAIKVNKKTVTKKLPKSQIEKITIAAPPAPPQFLETNQRLVFTDNLKSKLTWDPIESAVQYQLEISRSIKFKTTKLVPLTQNDYQFKPTVGGSYYFRLKASSATGLESSYSDPLKIQIDYPPIQADQDRMEAKYQARSPADPGQKKQFPLKWNSIPTAEKFLIEVDRDELFTNPQSITTHEPEGFVEVPQTGNYKFRESAYNKVGRKISSTTTIGEIVYRKVYQVSKPLLDTALKSMSYYFQKEYGQFVWLRWNSPENAAKNNVKYRLEISKNSDFKKLNFAYMVPDTKFLIKSKLPQGEYFWRVRTEEDGQVSDWSDIGAVKIHTK